MKKLVMIILCASIISPTFAFADNKQEQKGNNDSHKSAQMAQKLEKKSEKRDHKEENEKDDEKNHHQATTTPSTQPAKKLNYFLCKQDSGWNVVALEGERNKNSANTMGKFCMKLPHGFAKRFYGNHATTTPDILAPVISLIAKSGIASTTATVSWNTNELATGKLYYGTSTPLTTFVYNPALTLAHSFNLTGLAASTTYQLLFESKDASNNSATTTSSFVTTI